MKSILLFVVLMLSISIARAEPQQLATINDPASDDFGPGTLMYPQRNDFQPGDLDLLQMKISKDAEGFWFEARFKNPVRDPVNVRNTVGGDSLADFARKGFYQFNIDVYVDTDRIKGSGNIFTLPGRKVQIDPAYAWEKAVILTPRPEMAREQLVDALTEQFPKRTAAENEALVDKFMFFPERIKVRGKSIFFFVPSTFFAGTDGSDWAITAFVTGAMPSMSADISLLPSAKPPLERLTLGVMQPALGQPVDAFGYSGPPPSPVVDLLGGTVEQQKQQLAAMGGLTGVAWGPHAKASDAQVAAVPVDSIEKLFQPASKAAAPVTAKPAETAPAVDQSSVVKRLQTLQQLFEQKLIDENEYKEQKERILKEL